MVKDWHIKFKVQLNSLDKQSFIRLQPEIVDILLNKSIITIINKLYDEYEKTQKLSDYLSSQIINNNLSFIKKDYYYSVTIPNDYYHHLQSYGILSFNNKEGKVLTRKGTLDEEYKIESSVYKSPDGTEVPIFFKEDTISVYTGDFSLVKFNISYLKKPIEISYKNNISSDIHKGLHEKIIEHAVLLALETYSSDRVNSKSNLNNV